LAAKDRSIATDINNLQAKDRSIASQMVMTNLKMTCPNLGCFCTCVLHLEQKKNLPPIHLHFMFEVI
jgi:hypothetical protein